MHPSYINCNGSSSFSNMQSIMGNSSNNINDKLLADDGNGELHVILENKCLTGKRSIKKDRHSKINTARGPRDRRMRLSIDVAKKFFKLQDMLGFDKASNTIQWLLMKSKPAIQQLNRPSSASECEVDLSGIDDQFIIEKSRKVQVIATNKENLKSCISNKGKKMVERGVGNNIVYVDNSLAKEAREKARARARKRTTEKRNIGGDHQYSKFRPSVDQVMDQNTNQLRPWIPFGEDQVRLTEQAEYRNSHNFQLKQQIVGDDSSMMMSSDWSPSFLFNYHHNLGPCHEHQFSNLQILGNLWEGINN